MKKNKDEIWFNSKNGLLYYNLKTSTLYNYTYNPLFPKGYPESGIYNAFLSSSNILWTQSKSFDLYTADFNKNRFESTPIKIMDNAAAPGILYEMYEYSPNNILVRQKDGTGILDILTGKISPFPYKPDYNLKGWQGGIICFADDKDNKVWIGTYGGLFLFEIRQHHLYRV